MNLLELCEKFRISLQTSACGLALIFWALLPLQEAELLSVENSAQIFNLLSDVPGDIQDVDELLQVQ